MRILGITTIRSDYDLMSGVYRELSLRNGVDLQLLVAGAHLSSNYGHSVDLIRKDGLKILAEVECLIDGDTKSSRLTTAAVMLMNSISILTMWKPDLIVYAGDREDVLVGSILGLYLGIPTVHFFGGDHEKDGHADTTARHAASKMATFHVVSTHEHARRLLRMGEDTSRICVSGSVALDKFLEHVPPSWMELSARFPPDKKMEGFALLIYHPVDSEQELAPEYFKNIIEELLDSGIPVCGSYPNTDPGNHRIIEVIKEYEGHPKCWFYKNLERDHFLSLFKACRFIIGNSSAGILEAASVPVAAINIGLRQLGRYAGSNVIFAGSERAQIREAIFKACSEEFQKHVQEIKNPYGDGKSCERACNFILEKVHQPHFNKCEDPLDIPFK